MTRDEIEAGERRILDIADGLCREDFAAPLAPYEIGEALQLIVTEMQYLRACLRVLAK